jgi:hypothetical protein
MVIRFFSKSTVSHCSPSTSPLRIPKPTAKSVSVYLKRTACPCWLHHLFQVFHYKISVFVSAVAFEVVPFLNVV